MEEWLILHLFYHALNPMTNYMLGIIGTFMGENIDIATKLLNDMQDNSQWRVERSSSRR
jgi:hypothetical protein